jgi:fibronectin type 3 domain-containing protein
VAFASPAPPAGAASVFRNCESLEVVYVPQAAYGAYIAALAPSKPAGVRILSGEGSEFVLSNGVLLYYVGEGGDIVLPSEVTTIAPSAFRDNTAVTSVAFPEGLAAIGDYAFYGCTGLTSLDLPGGLASIGGSAFEGCTGISGGLELPDALATLGPYAFYGCSGLDGTLSLPASLASIGPSAFSGCERLAAIAFSEGLASIGSAAFSGCSNLGSLTLPDSLDHIGGSAFSGCSGLETVVFGSGLRRFNSTDQFSGCEKLSELVFKSVEPPAGTSNIFLSLTNLTTIYVYPDSLAAYQAALGNSLPAGAVFTVDPLMISVKHLRADRVYSSTVHLSWDEHFDSSITGYRLERNGETVATLQDTAYTDTGLTAGGLYTYTLYGITGSGAQTPGTAINVVPLPPVLETIRTNNEFNKVGITDSRIIVTAANTGNHQALDESHATRGTLYYLAGEERREIAPAILDATSLSSSTARYYIDWDIADVADGTYEVVFVLTDADGATAELAGSIVVDHSAPEQIINVMAFGDIDGILVSWSISSEVDTARYRIYRRADDDTAFSLIATINNRSQLNYFDTAVSFGRLYHYYVVGVNGFGQESVPSKEAAAIKGIDEEAPQVTGITPAHNSVLSGQVDIDVTAIDNVEVVRVDVSYALDGSEDWQLLASDSIAPFSAPLPTGQFADGTIRVRAVAYDAQGNEGTPLTCDYRIDNTGPGQVTGLGFGSTATSVTLYWDDVTDEDVSHFLVERKSADGTYAAVEDHLETLGTNILNLQPNTSYTYRVVAYDQQGNRGTPSEEITVSTLSDTTAPVVTAIAPGPGSHAQSIPLSVTAEDDYDLASITLQISRDKSSWEDVYSSDFPPAQRVRSLSYALDASGLAEGSLYVRALAWDRAGNASDSGPLAPLTEYVIDRTAPAAPSAPQATPVDGSVYLVWEQGPEKDLYDYVVYRSTTPDSGFEQLAGHVATLDYSDVSAEPGTTYYYALAARDRAGNLSALSAVVEAGALDDSTVPVIIGITPTSGGTLGGTAPVVSGYAYDNRLLAQIAASYTVNGGMTTSLPTIEGINASTREFSFTVPIANFDDGDTIEFSFVARDTTGLSSEPATASYTIDRQPPVVTEAAAVYADGSVTVTWTGGGEPDLSGYRVYRQEGTGDYRFIGSLQGRAGQTSYSLSDPALPLGAVSLNYRVEAIDAAGNSVTALAVGTVELPDRSAPKAVLNCEASMEVGVEYVFDALLSTDDSAIVAYVIDFGDGTVVHSSSAVHAYAATGDYLVTLTITDDAGNQAQSARFVSVRSRELLGTANVLVVDGNGTPVPGASVYFDLGEEGQVVRTTDGSGHASFTASAGKHAVGAVIPNNEWLPVKKDILVKAGAATPISLTLVQHTMIEASFDIHRMTFDEIVAAGIDISDPANQLIVEYRVHLYYGEKQVDVEFPYNPNGPNPPGTSVIVDDAYIWLTPIYDGWWGWGGSGGSGGGGGGGGGNGGYALGYIVIPVNVSILKDFYNVDLTIVNNAATEFKMLDNRVTLNVPSGLTIMETLKTSGEATLEIDEIPGQSKKTVTWILRGDEVGSYDISADYTGTLAEFDEPISAHFAPDKPIEVYGMTGLDARMDVAAELTKVGLIGYLSAYYNLSLTNNSDHEVYLPNIWTPDNRLMAPEDKLTLICSEYFDKEGTLASEGDTLGTNFLQAGISKPFDGKLMVLAPGEKITRHYRYDRYYGEEEDLPSSLPLQEYYIETITETYGLEFEVVPRQLNYFLSYVGMDFEILNPSFVVYQDTVSSTNPEDMYVLSAGATISCDGLPVGITGNDGSFDTSLLESDLITVSKPGYIPVELTRAELEATTVVYLDQDYPPGCPQIRKFTIDGEDAYRNTRALNPLQGEPHVVAATINWRNSSEDKLYLLQELEGEDPVTLVLEDGAATAKLGEYFSFDEPIYLCATNSEGVSTKKKIKVRMMSAEEMGLGLDMGEPASGNLPDDFPFLGAAKFEAGLALPSTPLNVEIDKNTVKLTFGVDLESWEKTTHHFYNKGTNRLLDWEKNDSGKQLKRDLFENIKSDYEELQKGISDLKSGIKGLQHKYGKLPKVAGKFGFDADLSVIGFCEWTIDRSGNLIPSGGGFILEAEAAAGPSGQFMAGPVPMYWEVFLKGKAEAMLELSSKSAQGNAKLEGTLKGSLTLGGEIGVGLHDVLSGGGGIQGTVDAAYTWLYLESGDLSSDYKGPWKVNGKVQAFAEVKALFYENKWEWNLLEAQWIPRGGDDSGGGEGRRSLGMLSTPQNEIAAYDSASYTLQSRAYAAAPTDFVANSASSGFSLMAFEPLALTNAPFITNVYPEADPQLVDLGGGKKLMVWLGDDAQRDDYNRTSLMYSCFNGSSWSEPVAVENDGTVDYGAELKILDGTPWLVWMDANRQLTSEDTLDTAAGALDISAARFDAGTGTFTDVAAVSSGSSMDSLPEIAATGNGGVAAVWAHSDADGFFANAGESTIFSATFDGEGWSEPAALYSNLNQLDKLALSYQNNAPLLAWAMDKDGDLTTGGDTELYLNGAQLTTDEAIDSKPQFVDGELYWYSDGQVARISDFSSQDISYLLPEGASIPTDRFQVVENASGAKAILFARPDGLRSEVYSYNYDSVTGQWGNASVVTESGGAINGFSGYLSNSGSIVCATNVRAVDDTALENGNDPYGQADLSIIERVTSVDLSTSWAYYDPDGLYVGNILPLTFDVTNNGGLAAHGLLVEVLDAEGAVLSSESRGDVLQPGATIELTADYQVPAGFSARSVQVRVKPLGLNDANLQDNSQTVELNRVDAALESADYGFTEDGELVVYAGVVNRGLGTLTDVTVNLTDDSKERNILATQTIDSLEPLNMALLRFSPELSASGGYMVEVVGPSDETMVGNNDAYVLVVESEGAVEQVGAPGSGDFDGDGFVTAADALTAATSVISGTALTDGQKAAVDIDKDGILTMADVVLIMRKAMGL